MGSFARAPEPEEGRTHDTAIRPALTLAALFALCGTVSPGKVLRVSSVFICRSRPGGRRPVSNDGADPERAIAQLHGLGWARYVDARIRIDLVEGDKPALGHAYRWLSESPDVQDAQGSEWRLDRSSLKPGEWIELNPPQHLLSHVETAHGLVLSDTSEAVAIMAKMVILARGAADARIRGGR